MQQIHSMMKYRKFNGYLFPMKSQSQERTAHCIGALQLTYACVQLHGVSHRQVLPWGVLKQHFTLDPWNFMGLSLSMLMSNSAQMK